MIIHIDTVNRDKKSPQTVLDHSKIDGRKSVPYSFMDRELTDDECSSLTKLVVDKMAVTLLIEDGLGLALPQLGIFNGRLFITLNQADQTIQAYFNPSYTYNPDTTTKETKNEGCLSVRKTTRQLFAIERPVSIQASWYHLDLSTKTFIKREETLTGLRARVFMHEYDHLQGISIASKNKNNNNNGSTGNIKKRKTRSL